MQKSVRIVFFLTRIKQDEQQTDPFPADASRSSILHCVLWYQVIWSIILQNC